MPIVNRVEHKGFLMKPAIIRFQLLTHCFLKEIALTAHELECLVLLALDGEAELNVFCRYVERKEVYASSQSVRNTLNKLERMRLVEKSGKKNKKVRLSSDIPVQTQGNILLEYKFAYIHEPGQI
jgi:hypothetical protein